MLAKARSSKLWLRRRPRRPSSRRRGMAACGRTGAFSLLPRDINRAKRPGFGSGLGVTTTVAQSLHVQSLTAPVLSSLCLDLAPTLPPLGVLALVQIPMLLLLLWSTSRLLWLLNPVVSLLCRYGTDAATSSSWLLLREWVAWRVASSCCWSSGGLAACRRLMLPWLCAR